MSKLLNLLGVTFGDLGKYAIDEKNRVQIPKEVHVHYGLKAKAKCILCVMPVGFAVWNDDLWQRQFESTIRDESEQDQLQFSKVKQDTFRILTATCETSQLDGSARVTIPEKLRKAFDGTNAVRIIATGTCVEIYKIDDWETYSEKTQSVWQVFDVAPFSHMDS